MQKKKSPGISVSIPSDNDSILSILESGFGTANQKKPSFKPRPPNSGNPRARMARKVSSNDYFEAETKDATPTTSPRPKRIKISSSTPDLSKDILVQKALEHKPLGNVPFYMYDVLLEELNSKANRARERKRFTEGVKIQSAMEYVQGKQSSAMEKQNKEMEKNQKKSERAELKSDIAAFDAETKIEEEIFFKKKNIEKQLIEVSQENEIRDLQELWSSPAKQRMFNRASNLLVSMRKRQSDYLDKNNFVEAKNLEKAIQAQERKETEENSEALQEAYNQALAKLKEKHARDDANFMNQLQVQYQHLKLKRETLRKAFDCRRLKRRSCSPSVSSNSSFFKSRSTENYHVTNDSTQPLSERAMKNKYKDITSIVLRPLVFNTKPEKSKAQQK